jgi:hypothetical protein
MPAALTVVAILDLPCGSFVNIDGKSVSVKRDDFVGCSFVPNGRLHLMTVRCAARASPQQDVSLLAHSSPAAVTVGFCFGWKNEVAIIRRFDPSTEEVSSSYTVDEVTAENLIRQFHAGQLGPERIVSYDQFVPSMQAEAWCELTNYVSERLLAKRGIESGAKLVPGCCEEGDWEIRSGISDAIPQYDSSKIVDGEAVSYPSIPVVDQSGGVRHSRHSGTKRFIEKLSSHQRTALFTDSTAALELILRKYYDNQWEDLLGDIQLAYVLFSFLHCYASLCHWRDLVAALAVVGFEGASAQPHLFAKLLDVLSSQLKTIDLDFFDDAEFSGETFLLPSLQRLVSTLSRVIDQEITPAFARFQRLVIDRFPEHFHGGKNFVDSEDEEEDGPIVVASDEVDAAFQRSCTDDSKASKTWEEIPVEIRQRYPFLFAAMAPNEDVVMTCARALDEATDVTLVREAAAYLEEVEAHR